MDLLWRVIFARTRLSMNNSQGVFLCFIVVSISIIVRLLYLNSNFSLIFIMLKNKHIIMQSLLLSFYRSSHTYSNNLVGSLFLELDLWILLHANALETLCMAYLYVLDLGQTFISLKLFIWKPAKNYLIISGATGISSSSVLIRKCRFIMHLW